MVDTVEPGSVLTQPFLKVLLLIERSALTS
jgi:hypothetical protein